jgi:hypothetical protein
MPKVVAQKIRKIRTRPGKGKEETERKERGEEKRRRRGEDDENE